MKLLGNESLEMQVWEYNSNSTEYSSVPISTQPLALGSALFLKFLRKELA